MPYDIPEVSRERFHLFDPNIYILQGYFQKEHEVEAYLDGTALEVRKEAWEALSAEERFFDEEKKVGDKVTIYLKLPENLRDYRTLTVYAVRGSDRVQWFKAGVKNLLKKQGKPYYFIEDENVSTSTGRVSIRGWVVFGAETEIGVFDSEKKKLPFRIKRLERTDVREMYMEAEQSIEEKCGFYIEIPQTSGKEIFLVFKSGSKKSVHRIGLSRLSISMGKLSKLTGKGLRYFHTHGATAVVRKVAGRLKSNKVKPVFYEDWIAKHLPDDVELAREKKYKFSHDVKFSIVVPLYQTPISYLTELISSVREQTYTNWELLLSDGSGVDSTLTERLLEFQKLDDRIRPIFNREQLHISENTNRAIEAAVGDYLVFMDHDDVITPNALFENALVIEKKPETDVIYSDEDKMDMEGVDYFEPAMKPDFNLDLLHTVNYICHLYVVKRAFATKVGLLDHDFDGAQDYDFTLRCIEKTRHIEHVPKILYHWRNHKNSTSENPESKMYAFDAGERALQNHFDRLGIPAKVYKGEYLGLYRTKYLWKEQPLISIIIPNKDHTDDLKRCIDAIDKRSTYRNFEYVIVENNSTEEETFAYYKELEESHDNLSVVYYKGGFNFSKINNFGASSAKGEYYLLLNNDTEIINDDWLEEMLGYCMRDDVGIVGARLYYEDDTIQHAGVIIGFGSIAGHAFVQQKKGATGYAHRIICAQDYSAVTAACMMVKKKVFDEVGGLEEALAVAFNDVDFCLKVRSAGYLVVYNPYAELHHFESKSRGLEDTPEKQARFKKEIDTFAGRWPEILKNGDPYYSPNLSLITQDFSLRKN